MITFPNCKINLGLNIVRKREDSYHDIETVFFPVKFNDALEILPSKNGTTFKNTGLYAGIPEDNLCIRAFNLLKKDFPQLPNVNIHLHKAIHSGAGLGGGSADAAFTLQVLDKIFGLDIPEKKMQEYALAIGSDCSFFLANKPCIATGRGELLKPINLSLSDYKILLINPGLHINTAEIFKQIKPHFPAKPIKEIIHQKIQTWKTELVNDFEKVVFEKYPQVKKIKENLYESGVVYSSMSGSGSTVYGIFNKEDAIKYTVVPGYFYKLIDVA